MGRGRHACDEMLPVTARQVALEPSFGNIDGCGGLRWGNGVMNVVNTFITSLLIDRD